MGRAPGRAALRRAFLQSSYGSAHERFWLVPTPPAARVSWALSGQRWAVVTAWNPGGMRFTAAQNDRAQQTLQQRWSGTAVHAVNGEGAWAEPSLILLDISLADSVALGQRFGQAAILYGVGRRVALVWLGNQGVCLERYWVTSSPPPRRPVPASLYSGGL